MSLMLFVIFFDGFFNLIGLAGILCLILAIGWGILALWEFVAEEY